MAYEHDRLLAPHSWNTMSCISLDEILTTPFFPDAEGFLTIPDRSGRGIELNREALKRFGV